MRYTFNAAQWVPYPVELVFAFFADPRNLPPLMPAWQHARIEESAYVDPPAPPNAGLAPGLAAGEGSRFTISFRPVPLSPLRLTWQALIVEFKWNDHFCDEQPQGPFGYWRHCHRVSQEVRGDRTGTTIVDELAYELPFNLLSAQINSLVVARQISGVFKYRQARLEPCLLEFATGLETHGT